MEIKRVYKSKRRACVISLLHSVPFHSIRLLPPLLQSPTQRRGRSRSGSMPPSSSSFPPPNLLVLLGLGLAGIILMARRLRRRVPKEDLGAFVQRLQILPPPPPPPPKAPHPLTGLTFAVADMWALDSSPALFLLVLFVFWLPLIVPNLVIEVAENSPYCAF